MGVHCVPYAQKSEASVYLYGGTHGDVFHTVPPQFNIVKQGESQGMRQRYALSICSVIHLIA